MEFEIIQILLICASGLLGLICTLIAYIFIENKKQFYKEQEDRKNYIKLIFAKIDIFQGKLTESCNTINVQGERINNISKRMDEYFLQVNKKLDYLEDESKELKLEINKIKIK